MYCSGLFRESQLPESCAAQLIIIIILLRISFFLSLLFFVFLVESSLSLTFYLSLGYSTSLPLYSVAIAHNLLEPICSGHLLFADCLFTLLLSQ